MGDKQDLLSYVSPTPEAIYALLNTSPNGLLHSEVQKRVQEYGYNTLAEEKKQHIVIEFLLNFTNPLVLILLCIVTISFFLGETVNAILVFSMVLMSASLNFFQEHRANRAAQMLKNKVAHVTCVIRGGTEVDVVSKYVVPGDLLQLNAGDLIPADARIVQAKDLFINQSVLTGESFPAEKTSEKIKIRDAELSDMRNIAFAGTSVITGSAKGVVVRTGVRTEFGKIAEKINSADEGNEFTRGIGEFSVMILRVILLFVLFIFFVNAFIRHDILEALTFSIAVAVGLTPEFLPMIMTVTMSKGSQKMAKKGVIVKQLSAIPTFGSMEILCTDKTGTLTEDKIKLVKYLNEEGRESENVFVAAYLNSSYQTGITNPMDEAIMKFKNLDIASYKKIDEIPFDFERKRMSVVVEHEGQHTLITKGAPEQVVESCTFFEREGSVVSLKDEEQKKLIAIYEALSKEGYRVLAVAQKNMKEKRDMYTKLDEHELVFVGFAAFLDPAKEGVKASIDELELMGIEVKVITGDNEFVSQKICSTVGIQVKGMLLGSVVDHLSDEELYKKSLETTVFARFSPSQKERVIKILKSHGKVVGYMGDGINDSPSLKASDVGISVSNGVDIAKESSDIILTNKSLHELAMAVVEGRKTYGNTMKYILMGLSSNFGNMFSVLGAVVFLPFLPMLPLQILLNNFLYDIAQVTIPSDNVDADFIQKPKRWNNNYIKNFMVLFGPISSIFDYCSFFVLFLLYRNAPGSFQTGWFMESLATQTLVIHVIRTKQLPFVQSTASIYLLASTLGVVILGWIIPFSPLGHYFGFSPLPPVVLVVLAGITMLYLVAAEVGKRIFFQKFYS